MFNMSLPKNRLFEELFESDQLKKTFNYLTLKLNDTTLCGSVFVVNKQNHVYKYCITDDKILPFNESVEYLMWKTREDLPYAFFVVELIQFKKDGLYLHYDEQMDVYPCENNKTLEIRKRRSWDNAKEKSYFVEIMKEKNIVDKLKYYRCFYSPFCSNFSLTSSGNSS